MKEVRKCAVCGNYFVATRINAECCSDDCKHTRRLKLEKELREQNKSEVRSKPRKRNKNSITDIAVEARKAGMTYGQYVAKMGI